MSIRTVTLAFMALAALLLVALAPTGAAAHGGAPHTHAAKHAGAAAAVKDVAEPRPAELRTQMPVSQDHAADFCDRGCCSAGHCSGCGTALAPAAWTGLQPATNVLLLNPDASQPTGLAREGPPRPPKSFA